MSITPTSLAIWSVALGTLHAAGGCGAEPPEPQVDPTPWAAFGDDLPVLVASNDRFALDLYAELAATKDGNLFFSPASISAALAMTYAGAAGGTAEQMAAVMHAELPQERLHGAWALLVRRMLVDGNDLDNRLRIANRLWGQEGEAFMPAFLRATRDEYGAELAVADFRARADSARAEINAWVSERTEGRIPDLIGPDQLSELTRLVLVNAIWFKGTWAKPFESDRTRDAPFRLDVDREVSVPMMSLTGERFRSAETDEAQVLELPYEGGQMVMILVLPRAADGLAAVEAGLSAERLAAWDKALEKTHVNVWLPRFEMRTRAELKTTLESLGMTAAFAPGAADFSGIDGTRDLSISAVIHEAWVKVDEEGTEAAAATGVVVGVTSVPITKQFRADHPFLVMIRHEPTGSILFMGRVMDPSKGA